MSSSRLRDRAAALRVAVARLGADLAAEAAVFEPGELFELSGDLQGIVNAADGAQLVAVAHASAHEVRLTGRGPVQVHHELGFVDAMAASEVTLATGLGQWAASRRVALASALAARFPTLLGKVVEGELATGTVQKVLSACDGLDVEACASVEAVLADRLAATDPARVTTLTRRVATRVARDQLVAATATNRGDRCVQVSPGPDGTTQWWALLPTDRSAAAWAAVAGLAEEYARKDESLTADQARADAFLDLLLTNVTVTAEVTLGIPVITGVAGEGARAAAGAARAAENTGRVGGEETASSDGSPVAEASSCTGFPAVATGGLGLGEQFRLSAALTGCEIPGIGFIDADTIEVLLTSVPTHVGRALLDARTGTLLESTSTAYRPPRTIADFVATRDGTCRMWGCSRPARRCDLDHARPWPTGPTSPANLGGLCRRHHRLKQRRRWAYRLDPDGTATWTSPSGRQRITLPDHATLPPPRPPDAATEPPPRALSPTGTDPPPF